MPEVPYRVHRLRNFVYIFTVTIAAIHAPRINRDLILVPTACNFTTIPPNSTSLYHIHRVYHLIVAFSGRLRIRNERGSFPVLPHDIIVVNPNEMHVFITGPDKEARHLSFNFYLLPASAATTPNDLEKAFRPDISFLETNAIIEPFSQVVGAAVRDVYVDYPRDRWNEIVSAIDFVRPYGSEYELDVTIYPVYPYLAEFHDEFSYFFRRICRSMTAHSGARDLQPSRTDRLVSRIVRELQRQSDGKFSLNRLSEAMGYSAPYLSNYFSKHVRTTLHNYHEKLRTQKAIELLKDRALMITSIAHQLGYSSSQHFSRCFSTMTGMSPTQYRLSLAEVELVRSRRMRADSIATGDPHAFYASARAIPEDPNGRVVSHESQ